MRATTIAGVALLASSLAACDQEQQTTEAVPPAQPPEQVERAEVPPGGGPGTTVDAFFNAMRGGQTAEAAAFISRDALVVEEVEMLDSLDQWADEIASGQNEHRIVDSHRENGYALVITRFLAPESSVSNPVLRPIVLVQEQGQWKIVWDLLGKEPHLVDLGDDLAQRLKPLYVWYEEREQALNQQAQAGG